MANEKPPAGKPGGAGKEAAAKGKQQQQQTGKPVQKK